MGNNPHSQNRSAAQSADVESQGQRVEQLCDQFEARWRDNDPPQLEDYLPETPGELRQTLFVELLGIELHWRRHYQQTPTPREYHTRFADQTEAIERAFRETPPADPNSVGTSIDISETLAIPAAGESVETNARQFGEYQLLEEIGRGGMGVVYRAWQPGANRFVALKVIRRDRLESLPADLQAGVVSRFQHEAQAAGQIEHDHIVTVYEVGKVDGEPFFSMRYVEGRSLADLLQDGPLSARQTATYIEPVARALHEAHLHGVLHRDLKPQNILVDAKTNRALLCDFGLAKLLEEADEMTQAGDVIGTPAYMSPEQATDSSRVTAKSDIYALGATMYHMLTGRPPFQASNLLETIRQVIDERPSPLREQQPAVPRDLETICVKSLEKEPTRRYASAETLADDLQRFLRGEPIAARPITTTEHVWRWCVRNPLVAGSLAAAVLFLIIALVATTVGYVQTSASLEIAQQEREKSDASFRQLRAAVDRFFTEISENDLMNQPGMQPLRQQFLEEAVTYYEQFLQQRGDDSTIQDELAATHFRVGRIRELIRSPREALEAYQKAYAMQGRLVGESPHNIQRLAALGNTANRIGRVLHRLQELDEALQAYREAVELRLQLTDLSPGDVEYARQLANSEMNVALVLRDRGEIERARERFQQAQAIRQRVLVDAPDALDVQRDVAIGNFNSGMMEAVCGRADVAAQQLKQATSEFEQLRSLEPRNLDHQNRLATCYRAMADLSGEQGDTPQALEFYQLAQRQFELLVANNPEVAEYRARLAGLLMNLGLLREEDAQWQAAADALAAARELLEQLVQDFPQTPRYRADLATALAEQGFVAIDLKNRDAARLHLEAARSTWQQLVEDWPDEADYRDSLTGLLDAMRQLRLEP